MSDSNSHATPPWQVVFQEGDGDGDNRSNTTLAKSASRYMILGSDWSTHIAILICDWSNEQY